jgi:hypothetical protein
MVTDGTDIETWAREPAWVDEVDLDGGDSDLRPVGAASDLIRVDPNHSFLPKVVTGVQGG